MLWINGKPEPNDTLVIDDGLWYGLGVFETIRVHDRPLFWTQHIQRLNAGLQALQVRDSLSADELLAGIRSLGIKNCVLKIAVTPQNILFATRPLPAEISDEYTLMPVESQRSRNPLLLGTKNLNYLENLLARGQAAANGYDDALYVESDGTISETCRANIFFIQDGRLKTPDLACGALPGIVRQWVIEQVQADTGRWTLNDLLTAEAVLVTNSVIGVRPVTRIGGQACPISSLALDLCHRYTYAATSQND